MSVTIKELEYCIAEAQRFMDAAREAHYSHKQEQDREKKGEGKHWDTGKYNAAARRASMDLSRALARLRKPGA